MEKVIINGITYVPENETKTAIKNDMRFCIIRTYSAGVHIGYLAEKNGREVKLLDSRRLWKWAGAFTLSEMSRVGVRKPEECRFSCVIPEITLTEAIEIIPCTELAMKSLMEVKTYEC